jgi:glucosamine 6-phosphate synthetase-like amidotransferase/phosphosugar isomerase protein
MMHTRNASVGGNENNINNHPIVTDPIIGIHNGTLYNDDQLFREFGDYFEQEGTVDSEVIFRMLNMYLEDGLDPKEALQQVTSKLLGAFTGAAVDMRHTHRMLMFKHQRELAVLKLAHYDIIVAVSEVRYYDAARAKLKLKAKDTCVYPREKTGFTIDVNAGRITDRHRESSFDLPVRKQGGDVSTWRSWVEFEGLG